MRSSTKMSVSAAPIGSGAYVMPTGSHGNSLIVLPQRRDAQLACRTDATNSADEQHQHVDHERHGACQRGDSRSVSIVTAMCAPAR